MSTNRMISVPRTLDEVLAELPGGYSRDDVAYGWHECLDNMPATQPQGEPVTLPMRRSWSGIAGWKDQAEIKAWNACLDEIAKLGPLYTHVDPAEIERLREKADHLTEANRLLMDDCDTLRAQLAEAHALLRDAHEELVCRSSPVAKRIDAALSASAETSAPADATHYYPKAEPYRQWRKKAGGLWCEFCGGKWLPLDEQGMSHNYVAIEPSDEQVPPDERVHGIPGTSFQRLNALANEGE